MIRGGLAKSNLYVLFIITLLLALLVGGSNILANPQRAATLDRLEKENLELRGELGELSSRYEELQDSYERLMQEKRELENGLDRSMLSNTAPIAYLTFDDGPGKYTVRLLKILKKYSVPATFFVTGKNGSGDKKIYRRIVEQGHALGNHTNSHDYRKIYSSKKAFMEDLRELESLLEHKAGIRPGIVRLPGGTSNTLASPSLIKSIIGELEREGYDYIDWNIDANDCNHRLTPPRLVKNVLKQADRLLGEDLVILLHDTKANQATVKALPRIIEGLRERGYSFAALEKDCVSVKHR
ncbi:polysaccharide deacetylase family protein [Candidatus Darwinibacter acetoxidans]